METSPLESFDGPLTSYKKEADGLFDLYFYPDQYNNLANPWAYFKGPGVEIWEQSERNVTHFVSGLGTSGTFMSTSCCFKDYNPATKVIMVQPDSPIHGI